MIEIEHLTKVFGTETAVDDVSLTVPEGTITVIVGTSGSGKSTLIRMVNRLIEPTSGRVLIDGEDTAGLKPHLLRRRIGYAIQDHGLFPHRTVAENIGTVPKLLGRDRAAVARRVDELLTLFQLDPAQFAGRYPHELSGGQQQRVGVARALAAEPRLLLMDEPFGSLDPIIRAKARQDLKAIQRKLGTTVLLVTHDMEEAIDLGDRLAVMDAGRLLQYAAPTEVLLRPATPFVADLVGIGDRPFRVLSLRTAGEAAEPGPAEGPPIPAATDLREALAQFVWTRRRAAPVVDADGRVIGRLTLERLLEQAARPA
ncbi:ABC transporter ATP-binding protein [Prosthecomicrobium sp. N25]|uniref:ABC transporter ATP-binding protein n=1 Tax=Prosthecomicrobium sp. N25 TaxID=3129254 RepID=UPI0030773705